MREGTYFFTPRGGILNIDGLLPFHSKPMVIMDGDADPERIPERMAQCSW